MSQSLMKIKPFYPELNVPEGGELVGHTASRKPIYKFTQVRAGPHIPKVNPETGEPVFAKHPTTGEPMYQRFVRAPETQVVFKTPFNEGNGNISWEEYRFPTEAELKAVERAQKIEAMKEGLAAALVDKGIDPENLLATLAAPSVRTPEPESVPAPVVEAPKVEPPKTATDAAAYPVFLQPGKWRLSNGSVVETKKRVDAEAAEQAIQDAKTQMAAMPEE